MMTNPRPRYIAIQHGAYAEESSAPHCDDCAAILAGSIIASGASVQRLLASLDRLFPDLSGSEEAAPGAETAGGYLVEVWGDAKLHGGYVGIMRASEY